MATKRKQPPPTMVLKPLDMRINKQIKSPTVRLVVGEGHEVVSIGEALARAEQQGLDLVEVAGQAAPPVCKLLDFASMQADHKQSHVELVAKKKAAVKQTIKDKELRVGYAQPCSRGSGTLLQTAWRIAASAGNGAI